ncbi:MAG: hypothetical protein Q9218_003708 [Villophora microphyllina]
MNTSERDLVFVNLSKLEDFKSAERRKIIRSQAAKDHSQSSSSKPEVSSLGRHGKFLTVDYNFDSDRTNTLGTSTLQADRGSSIPTQSHALYPKNAEQRLKGKQTSQRVDSPAPQALRSISGAGWTPPFIPYPNKHFVPAVLAHADLSAMAVDIPGSLRSIWFPMVIAGRATLDVVVLTAAAHYVMVGRTVCEPEFFYKLKEDAITSINRALQSPKVDISDQLIGAVAKMAAFEAGFAGDEAQYHIHMRGLLKMVELRGGLESLGLNGLLGRMLLWIDLNASVILKTKLYFVHTNRT